MKTFPITKERAVLEELRKKFAGLQITPSYLFDRAKVLNQRDSYELSLRGQNRTNERPLSLLQDTDVFIPLRWKFGLQRENDAKPGTSPIYSYPNAVVFGAQAPDLMAFFHGEVSLKISDLTIFDPAPAQQFYEVPETQQRAAVASVEGVIALDSFREETGMRELETMPVLNGKQTILLNTRIPTYTSINIESTTAGTSHYWVSYIRGLKVSSAAETHYKQISDALRALFA